MKHEQGRKPALHWELMAKSKDKEQSFETSLSTLEQIVAQLESGDLPLEHALELFEDGVGLARRCQLQLQDAERKVELLLRERGEIKVVPFESSGDGQSNEMADSRQLAQPVIQPKKPDAADQNFDDTIPF